MRAVTEGSLPPVMPQGNLVEVLGREVRQESQGELMVESTPSRQRRPPCKTNKEESEEAADAAALTYLLTYLIRPRQSCPGRQATFPRLIQPWGLWPLLLVLPRMIQSAASAGLLSLDYRVRDAVAPAA